MPSAETSKANGRRRFLGQLIAVSGSLLVFRNGWARNYLSVVEAQALIWPEQSLTPVTVELDRSQRKAIEKASGTRVRQAKLQAWKTTDGDWFVVDQVIGKHENIDIAVGLSRQGQVTAVEILVYRETYGFEVRNDKWRAQFHGRDHREHLQLDKQIKNISGATLSCSHITDGINRLTHTWNLVLQKL